MAEGIAVGAKGTGVRTGAEGTVVGAKGTGAGTRGMGIAASWGWKGRGSLAGFRAEVEGSYSADGIARIM